SGADSVALGFYSTAFGDYGVAVGPNAFVNEDNGVALGSNASVDAANSVALGADSVADRDNTVSVGGVGNERQITNVADGRIAAGSTDAVTGGQVHGALDSLAQAIGGGAEVTAFGTLSAPAFMIQGSTYFSVGDALGALDAHISMLDSRLVALEGSSAGAPASAATGGRGMGGDAAGGVRTDVPAGDVGVGGPAVAGGGGAPVADVPGTAFAVGQGAVATQPTATAIGDGATATAANSVALGHGSVADRANTVSVGSAGNERQITNVAAGTQATDAVNVAQLESTATRAVADANAYTDQRFNAWADSFSAYQTELERRFTDQDRRIDRQGAMGAAMLNMATSAAGIRTQNRLGVGVGFQGGQSALSVGYQRAISERATVTIGGAFSGDEKSVGLGAGFGW